MNVKSIELSIEIAVTDDDQAADDILTDVMIVLERRGYSTLTGEVVRDDRTGR